MVRTLVFHINNTGSNPVGDSFINYTEMVKLVNTLDLGSKF